MFKIIILAVIVLCSGVSFARIAPDFITPCKEITPECLKNTIQEAIPKFVKGDPSIGLNVTDPFPQAHEQIDLPGVKIEFYDGIVTGLRKCIVDSARYGDDVLNLNFHCNVTIKGKYKANGRLLIVTINGDGNAKIKVSNIIINAVVKFADVPRDGKVFYDVVSHNIKHRFGDKVSFSFTNLFKGSPEISEAVLAFLNSNWRQVADEFGEPIVSLLVNSLFKVVRKFFNTVPKDELFV